MSDLFSSLRGFEFGEPWWLLLLLGLVPLWRWRRRLGPAAAVTYSSLQLVREVSRQIASRPGRWQVMLRTSALVLIVVALARPRVERASEEDKAKGIDIMLILDASRSMDSKDFDCQGRKVSRRDALEQVMGEFIKERPRDRIGVIGFAEKSFLISPLTLDHSWMMEALHDVQTSLGTAIGSAVEAGVDLLRKSEGTDKVAIVVTDGLNTSGVDPMESARTARRYGVRLYTIGVVSYAEMQTGGLDAVTLNLMARLTGGQFFQAANGTALLSIYRQIDEIERREFRQPRLRAYRELFPWLVAGALGLLAAELVLAHGRRMRLP
jgi:Ca-activated chloride channel family protein